jgi:hypothetical protein
VVRGSQEQYDKDIQECQYDAEKARLSADWRMQNTLEVRDQTMIACMKARGVLLIRYGMADLLPVVDLSATAAERPKKSLKLA